MSLDRLAPVIFVLLWSTGWVVAKYAGRYFANHQCRQISFRLERRSQIPFWLQEVGEKKPSSQWLKGLTDENSQTQKMRKSLKVRVPGLVSRTANSTSPPAALPLAS